MGLFSIISMFLVKETLRRSKREKDHGLIDKRRAKSNMNDPNAEGQC